MTNTSSVMAALAAVLLLTLAGCRNPPPSTAIKTDSPALRGIKSWVAAGAGPCNTRFTGSLTCGNQSSAVIGHLDLINAYRFTLAVQSTNGQCAFVLHRNWAGAHYFVQPHPAYAALAKAIGTGVSLAFRRPEGPWHAAVKAGADVVVYKGANANRFQWDFMADGKGLLLTHLRVQTPSGPVYVITFNTPSAKGKDSIDIADSALHFVLHLRLHNNSEACLNTRIP